MVDAANDVPQRPLRSPPGGWAHFVARYFGREPVLYRRAFDASFVDGSRVHRLLLRASARLRQGEPVRARVFLERGRQDDTAAWLPKRERTLQGYVTRLRKERRGRDFTVVINGGAAHDVELYRRCRSFLCGLNAAAGVSLLNDAVIYLSHARASTFGVHQDPDHNFLFVVRGHKRFRVWKKGVLERRPRLIRSQRYDEIAGTALSFDVGPGDLLYIPAGAYHVAESDRALAVHLSLLVNDDPDTAFRLAADAALEIARERTAGATKSGLLQLHRAPPYATQLALPPGLARAAEALGSLDAPLRRALLQVWAVRLSAFGFRDVPPLRAPASLRDEQRVCLDEESGLLCYRAGAFAVCAANGHAYRFPAHPGVVAMIERLAGGAVATVGELIARAQGIAKVGRSRRRATPAFARAVLVMLYRMRAIRVARAQN
jgi:hypothetical protein